MTHVHFHANDRVARYHAWRARQGTLTLLALALGWAALTGLLAQVRVPLPFTPVPFTMQVFPVLLGGVLLGTPHGALAQALYVGLGVAGVPWFQGHHGGWEYFVGPTGGYLLAYPVAALVAGLLVHARRRALLAMVAGLAVIYALGAAWLAVALDVGLHHAVLLGVAPFVAVDLLKVLAAAGVARALADPRA